MDRTHYEILGIPKSATAEEVRKRYRELARKFHPDVNSSDDATQQFQEINYSYEVLIDPQRRSNYDIVLELSNKRATVKTAPKTTPAKPSVDKIKTGQALLQDAHKDYVLRKLQLAEKKALESLNFIPNNAASYALLGDIRSVQNRMEEAIKYYTFALQYAPKNVDYKNKLESLIKNSSARPGRINKSSKAIRKNSFWIYFGWLIAFFGLFLPALFPGTPSSFFSDNAGFIAGWSLALLSYFFVDGMLVGALLFITNNLEPFSISLRLGKPAKSGLPPGAFLIVISSVWFWAGAVVYLLIGNLQNSLNAAMNQMFIAAGILTLVFTFLYEPAHLQTFLFGGNIIFLSMMMGWACADYIETI